MSIASFDIGVRNLGLSVQSFDESKLKIIENLPKNKRYNTIDGTATEEFQSLMNKVYLANQIIYLEPFDLLKQKDKKLDNSCYVALFDWLDSKKQLFEMITHVLIECQMTQNFKACCLQHCISSWFLINFRNAKEVIIFPSRFKTQVVGAQKKIIVQDVLKKTNKQYRKNFAKIKVKEILELRNDQKNSDFIFLTNKKKQDDLCDSILQCQAFLYMKYVEKIDDFSNNLKFKKKKL